MNSSFGRHEFWASGVGGVGIQSVTTILEDFRSPLNCAGEAIWTVFDILNVGMERKSGGLWMFGFLRYLKGCWNLPRGNNVTRIPGFTDRPSQLIDESVHDYQPYTLGTLLGTRQVSRSMEERRYQCHLSE